MPDIDLYTMGQRARKAGRQLALLSSEVRDGTLREIARRLEGAGDALWQANRADIEEARAAGLTPALLDRSTLNPNRLAAMVQGCRDVAALPDPLGEVFDGKTLPNGLRIAKKRVPLGVLGVFFEARPNVTVDIGALASRRGIPSSCGEQRVPAHQHRAGGPGARRLRGLRRPGRRGQLITSTDRALVLRCSHG